MMGSVTGWQRVAVWAASIIGGLALIGLRVFFVVNGLDRASKLASVIGVFVGLLGLVVSVYGVALARRGPTQTDG
jgi:Co/Zn/Cd efflux system component